MPFSLWKLAFAGFQVLGPRPWTFLAWCLVLSVPTIATALLSGLGGGLELHPSVPVILAISLLVLTPFVATVIGAVFRTQTEPASSQMAFLRFSRAELCLWAVGWFYALPLNLQKPWTPQGLLIQAVIVVLLTILGQLAASIFTFRRISAEAWPLLAQHFRELLVMNALAYAVTMVIHSAISFAASAFMRALIGITSENALLIVAQMIGALNGGVTIVLLLAPQIAAYRRLRPSASPAEMFS